MLKKKKEVIVELEVNHFFPETQNCLSKDTPPRGNFYPGGDPSRRVTYEWWSFPAVLWVFLLRTVSLWFWIFLLSDYRICSFNWFLYINWIWKAKVFIFVKQLWMLNNQLFFIRSFTIHPERQCRFIHKYNCSKRDEIYLSNWQSLYRIHPQFQPISQCICLPRLKCNKAQSFINYESFILSERWGIPPSEKFYPLMEHINSSNINQLPSTLIRIASRLLSMSLSINEQGQGQFRVTRSA